MMDTHGSFFFFLQAEDGIRDLTVTGVQTCALPIPHRSRPGAAVHSPPAPLPGHCASRTRSPPHRSRRRRRATCKNPSLVAAPAPGLVVLVVFGGVAGGPLGVLDGTAAFCGFCGVVRLPP